MAHSCHASLSLLLHLYIRVLRLHAECHACRALVTVMSLLHLLRCNAEYALFVQQQVQQAVKPGKYTQIQFHCYMMVCLQSLQQQAIWPRLQPHIEGWWVCDMQGGPRGRPNCSWPQQSQGGQRRHHLCSAAGNLIHPLAHSVTFSPTHLLNRSLACSLAHSITHSPTRSHAHEAPSPTHLPAHQPIHPGPHSFT